MSTAVWLLPLGLVGSAAPPRTAVIAGGGIAGLTLALKLHSVGISCTVYESVHEIRAIGVGINIQTSGVLELYKLGLREALDRTGVQTRELAYYLDRAARLRSLCARVH